MGAVAPARIRSVVDFPAERPPLSTVPTEGVRRDVFLVPGATQADEPEQFSLAHVEGDRPHPPCLHVRDAEHPCAFAQRGADDFTRLAPDDQRDKFIGIGMGNIAHADHVAITQDSNPVGDPENLIEAMRDIDHADTLVAERAKGGKQPFNLIGGKARGGFVQNQKIAFDGECTGNCDE